MSNNTEIKFAEDKMNKSISVYNEDLATIRAGRANPAILDKITVEYYGTATPIPQVGTVSVPEARTLVIQPWDASILSEVERAILKSDIGINPNNDGKVIRLNFPPLTEERRKDLVKGVNKRTEEAKVAIRSIRREFVEQCKAEQKRGDSTEDDLKDLEADIQKLTDKKIEEIDKTVDSKCKEIMSI